MFTGPISYGPRNNLGTKSLGAPVWRENGVGGLSAPKSTFCIFFHKFLKKKKKWLSQKCLRLNSQ